MRGIDRECWIPVPLPPPYLLELTICYSPAVAQAIPRLASSRDGSEPARVRTGYTGMIQFSLEDRFMWLRLVGNTMPPRHPNNDDNDEEGDEEEEDDEKEPAVIREPDEGE
jgi:hypothetical protein